MQYAAAGNNSTSVEMPQMILPTPVQNRLKVNPPPPTATRITLPLPRLKVTLVAAAEPRADMPTHSQ